MNTTADGQCILGQAPGLLGLFLAVLGKAGYTSGPFVGLLATLALLSHCDAAFDIASFTPARFGRPASTGPQAVQLALGDPP